MKAALLGNGFDLHHKFPTRYIDFLNVVQFIIDNKNLKFRFVSDVLGNSDLHEKDSFIKKCYETHKIIYDECEIEASIDEIKEKASNNIWFNFLHNRVNKNIGWIDFEKEIVKVIKVFSTFFDYDDFQMYTVGEIMFELISLSDDPSIAFILRQFDYFFGMPKGHSEGSVYRVVKSEYSYEDPIGSDIYEIDKEKIISKLYQGLMELADLLKVYLHCFVDNPTRKMAGMMYTPICKSYPCPDKIFTFNYTQTYELLYRSGYVYHLHGNTISNIVLGVNPDETDELYDMDTSFLQFKKYFQRTFFKTDLEYLNYIESSKKMQQIGGIELTVIGHSLDITDEDIIRQLFDQSKKITVLYHDDTSVKNQIKNLVEIYGKNEFDRLRLEKKLTFLPQAELTWTIKE